MAHLHVATLDAFVALLPEESEAVMMTTGLGSVSSLENGEADVYPLTESGTNKSYQL